VRIALDAMGTDRHPVTEVQAAVQALRELPGDFSLILVGDRSRIEAELAGYAERDSQRLTIVHASQTVNPEERAVTAVRRKQDSSIVVGLSLQQRGEVDAFVSAGSTGAVMAASLFHLRKLRGVDRPTVATILPTMDQPLLLADAGANVDCKPHQLLQFAKLGAIYVEDVWCRARPRVGLLNIGEEPSKGDELAVATHKLLAASELNFIGNVEGRDVIRGVCDVLVADGFVGNVLLKFYESVTGVMHGMIRDELERAGAQVDLEQLFRAFDYTEYGGAPLLGVNGVTIICHGGSPPRAVCNGIRVATQAVEARMVEHMANAVREQGEAPGSVPTRSARARSRQHSGSEDA
jgi:phosphate acyltransferase